jgi:hypothetical protein
MAATAAFFKKVLRFKVFSSLSWLTAGSQLGAAGQLRPELTLSLPENMQYIPDCQG